MKKKIGIFLVLIAIIVISVTTYSYLANKDGKNAINQNDEEEISLKSEELKDLLKYIQNDKIYKYDSDYLINIYYSDQKTNINEMPNHNKINFAIAMHYLDSNTDICQLKNVELTSEEVASYIKEVYGPDVIYEEVEEGNLFNFKDGKYTLKLTNCDEDDNLFEDDIKTVVTKATKKESEIKVYQKMAYIFKRTRINEDQSKTEYYTFLTGFDVSGIPVYSDVPLEDVDSKDITIDDFNTYIFTFKKESDSKYYFYSVEPSSSNKPQKLYEE